MSLVTETSKIIMESTSVDPTFSKILSYFRIGHQSNIKIMAKPCNIWLLSLGESSITHKSSATRKALENLSSTSLGTVDGLMQDISSQFTDEYDDPPWFYEEETPSLVVWSDEFGGFLKQAKTGSAGYRSMVDVLDTIHAGKPYKFPSRRGASVNVPAGFKLSLIASTTPVAFTKNCTPEILNGGLLRRMMLCAPEKALYVPPWDRKDMKFPTIHGNGNVDISPDVRKMHEEWMKSLYSKDSNSKMSGILQREEDNLFKIAALHAVHERGKFTIVEEDYTEALALSMYSASIKTRLVR